MNIEKIERISVFAGFKNLADLLVRFFMPTILVTIVMTTTIIILSPNLLLAFGVFFFGVCTAFGYPLLRYNAKRSDVHKHLHYFITYAGTISTTKISRPALFRRIAERHIFGEISILFEKIFYLAKKWNLGFAYSCRKISYRSPSTILADFLDRFAVVMDFGQSFDIFLYDEQKSVLDDYSVEYKKSLETIKLLQELFVAFSISFSFIMGIGLLAPILLDYPIELIMMYALFALMFVNSVVILAIKVMVPSDRLLIEAVDVSNVHKRLKYIALASSVITLALYIFLTLVTTLSFIVRIAIAIAPLMWPAIVASREETRIKRSDRQFPVYARVLG